MAVVYPPEALRSSGDALALPHADCYWIWPGRFLAGAYPATNLESLLAAGIDSFVDLTCDEQSLSRYAGSLPPPVRWHGHAITDFSVPSVALMRSIVGTIDAELQRGACVYLHCHAGVGRTGTALGCWLVEQGLSGPDALGLIASKRSTLAHLPSMPDSPETVAQRSFVLGWKALGAGR